MDSESRFRAYVTPSPTLLQCKQTQQSNNRALVYKPMNNTSQIHFYSTYCWLLMHLTILICG